MPLVQWILNLLDPVQPAVGVAPSTGTGSSKNLLVPPVMTANPAVMVPATFLGLDLSEIPQLQRGESSGAPSIQASNPSEIPSIVVSKPAAPAIVTSSKTLSSSSLTSKSIAGKPSIRRRS